jgi:hypothetical protein
MSKAERIEAIPLAPDTTPQPYTVSEGQDALVGRYFHTRKPDRSVNWQGHVVAKVGDGLYLVQLYDWFMGDLSSMHIIRLADMAGQPDQDSWQFYESRSHWLDWYSRWGSKR